MSESIIVQDLLRVITGRLREISNNTRENACCQATTSAGLNTNIPAEFGSVSIVLLSGSINVAMSDGTLYPMSTVGESFIQAASANTFLPAYTITGTGTWKWNAIK